MSLLSKSPAAFCLKGLISLALVFLALTSWSAPSHSPTTPVLSDGVPSPYPAPVLLGISNWINSSPIRLEQLKGKVVLVVFWTSSCYYCKKSLPYFNDWYKRYQPQGLVMIGIHSPKEEWESNPQIVQKAIVENDIHYPVAMDNHFETWKNYQVNGWPALYLINKQGMVVYFKEGATDFATTENNIQALLQN